MSVLPPRRGYWVTGRAGHVAMDRTASRVLRSGSSSLRDLIQLLEPPPTGLVWFEATKSFNLLPRASAVGKQSDFLFLFRTDDVFLLRNATPATCRRLDAVFYRSAAWSESSTPDFGRSKWMIFRDSLNNSAQKEIGIRENR